MGEKPLVFNKGKIQLSSVRVVTNEPWRYFMNVITKTITLFFLISTVAFASLDTGSSPALQLEPFVGYKKFTQIYNYGLIAYEANVYDCSNMASEFAYYLIMDHKIDANVLVIKVTMEDGQKIPHAIVEIPLPSGNRVYVDPSANKWSNTIQGLSYGKIIYNIDPIYLVNPPVLLRWIKDGYEEYLPYDPRNK